MKVGYYEFEGEDKYPEEEETSQKDSSSNTNPGTSRKSSSNDWKKGSSSARSLTQSSPARASCETTVKCR